MLSTKRVVSATILGVVFGIVCWLLARSGGEIAWYLALSIILSRTVMGFAIGISGWQIWWWLHGISMGIIFSLPGAFGALDKGGFIFWGTIVMGIIYGFLIELITTKAFKATVAKE
ncbi:MAG: hypothetical protein KAV99_06770 [Candidatus Latescibacteria bacterium]|nr:hypothetical protein [Candidatus Latescibacterota bacterium]